MSKLIDLTGERFYDLVVVKRLDNTSRGVSVWECLCDCGNITKVRGNNLRSGAVKSCGCRRSRIKPTMTHNMSKTSLYSRWALIKRRCDSPNYPSYKDYGGRGIKVCKEWHDSFENFADWALNNGYSENLTIESPENCTWITKSEQARNRRSSYSIKYKGKTQNLTDWCKELNLPFKTIHSRIYRQGWSFERALSEPVNLNKRNKKYA